MRKRKRLLVLAMALVLCLTGCAYEDDASPTAAYDGTWYFALNGAECKFTDGQIYRYDKNALDGQSLTGIYSAAGDHIDANVAYIGSLDQVRPLYIVSGENGDFLCDKADGSGTVYFYRDATAYLSTLGTQDASEALDTPDASAPPSPEETSVPTSSEPGELLTLEPLEPDPSNDTSLAGTRAQSSPSDPEPLPETKSGGTVWIPQSGSKYHSTPSCSGMKNPRQVSLSEAQSKGYTACKRCH